MKLQTALNAFCATGKGGGRDNSCPPNSDYTNVPRNVLEGWKEGRYYELASFLKDQGGAGTFIEFQDVDLDYLYPVLIYGDETLFEKNKRMLVEYAQSEMQKVE